LKFILFKANTSTIFHWDFLPETMDIGQLDGIHLGSRDRVESRKIWKFKQMLIESLSFLTLHHTLLSIPQVGRTIKSHSRSSRLFDFKGSQCSLFLTSEISLFVRKAAGFPSFQTQHYGG
jgi:hypothetical protein